MSDLYQMQAMSLKDKVRMTQRRIEEWYEHYDGQVYVSFSGGKDSTVLLHLVREKFPDVPAVFVDTGLEFPEIRKFVLSHDNVTVVKPKMSFVQVIKKYGYPMFSKEVSECVYGARKYLTSLIESGTLDRPTDRPKAKYYYEMADLLGIPCRSKEEKESREYQNLKMGIVPNAYNDCMQKLTGGGGAFNRKPEESVQIRGREIACSWQIWKAIEYAHDHGFGTGGAVRDFANLTGTRGHGPRQVNPKNWVYYDRFASISKADFGKGFVFIERKDSKDDRGLHGGLGEEQEGEYP